MNHPGLKIFNELPSIQAENYIYRCCGSKKFAKELVLLRPFSSVSSLIQASSIVWFNQNQEEWLHAFSQHPRIGDTSKSAATGHKWEAGEQSGARDSSTLTLNSLHRLNNEYYDKNGFVFLICATGKSGDFMLNQLKSRIRNTRETEIQIAANEQQKITELRIYKMLDELSPRSKL